MEVLIHEMGHVWQYQNGGLAYIPESLIAQLKRRRRRRDRAAATTGARRTTPGSRGRTGTPSSRPGRSKRYNGCSAYASRRRRTRP